MYYNFLLKKIFVFLKKKTKQNKTHQYEKSFKKIFIQNKNHNKLQMKKVTSNRHHQIEKNIMMF